MNKPKLKNPIESIDFDFSFSIKNNINPHAWLVASEINYDEAQMVASRNR